jgi:hypothetical protein
MGAFMKHPKLFLALILLIFSASAYAGGSTWTGASIINMTAYATGGTEGKGYVIVTLSSNGAGTPDCARGYPRNVAIDLSTPGGAFAAALAQSARLMGATVTVTGAGNYTVIPTAETLASIQAAERS